MNSIDPTNQEILMNQIEIHLRKEIRFIERFLKLPKNLLPFIVEGKRIRSRLIINSNFLNSKNKKKSLACLIELTHASSLIHDDIVDESDLRRGSATANKTLTIPSAASIGYLIFSRLFLWVTRMPPFLYTHYFHALKEMCIGQIMEIETMKQKDATIPKYLKTIRYKTGSLFALCFGLSENRWNPRNAALGYRFGTAFQILDDIYDVTLEQNITGKPFMQDAQRGILTLPFLYKNLMKKNGIDQEVIQKCQKKAVSFISQLNISTLPFEWLQEMEELKSKISQISET